VTVVAGIAGVQTQRGEKAAACRGGMEECGRLAPLHDNITVRVEPFLYLGGFKNCTQEYYMYYTYKSSNQKEFSPFE
jgi:hypothetical protein